MLPEFKVYLKGKHVGYLRFVKIDEIEGAEKYIETVFDGYSGSGLVELKDSWLKYDRMRQWTYRFDKNGKKIYEGDKVEMFGVIFIVRWEKSARYLLISEDDFWELSSMEDSEMEVVDEI